MLNFLKNFKRTIEDFDCDNCGFSVKGNGYTNHCPKCLWSKHVDIKPGDRASDCMGLMKPISIEQKRGHFVIVYQCQKCKLFKKNKTAKNDDIDQIIKISSSNFSE